MLGNQNFDDIEEKHLKELIENQVPEGLNIEYKRATCGTADKDKKEFLKDVSALANTHGGHLILGMEEGEGDKKGLPVGLKALDVNKDEEKQRLESLIRDGVEPRITGIRIKPVDLADGGFVLVLRVPRSWNPPHRVHFKGQNRFYVRNSSGAHETSVEELRALFNHSATLSDRMRAFRRERLGLLAAGEGPVPLQGDGRLVMHIMPFSAFGLHDDLDMVRVEQKAESFRLMNGVCAETRFNFEGFLIYNPNDNTRPAYTQVFRSGIVEAIWSATPQGQQDSFLNPPHPFLNWTEAIGIIDSHCTKIICGILFSYLGELQSLDVPPPLAVMLTLQDVAGARLFIDRNDRIGGKEFTQPELLLPEVIINDYGTMEDYKRAMHPAFDVLWNAAGFAKCGKLDETWHYITPQ